MSQQPKKERHIAARTLYFLEMAMERAHEQVVELKANGIIDADGFPIDGNQALAETPAQAPAPAQASGNADVPTPTPAPIPQGNKGKKGPGISPKQFGFLCHNGYTAEQVNAFSPEEARAALDAVGQAKQSA